MPQKTVSEETIYIPKKQESNQIQSEQPSQIRPKPQVPKFSKRIQNTISSFFSKIFSIFSRRSTVPAPAVQPIKSIEQIPEKLPRN